MSGSRWPLEPGEEIRLERRPDAAHPIVSAAGFVLATAIIAAPGVWLAGVGPWAVGRGTVVAVAAAAVLARLVWGEVQRRCRRYALTDRRVLAREGVFGRRLGVVSLDQVQHTVLARRFRDRLTGIGSVGVATAATGGIEIAWIGVRDPEAVLARIDAAAATARAGDSVRTID